jgi:uncharacterized protein (TIGR03435 family)
VRIAVLCAATVVLGSGQTGPRFDVASVKSSTPQSQRGSDGGPGSKDPSRYIFNAATLQDLITIAYDLAFSEQIASKTPVDRDTYDVAVKLPEGTSKADFRLMMQNLLAERFRLKLHKESRDFPTWNLVAGKGGPKLQEWNGNSKPTRDGFPELPTGHPGISASYTSRGPFTVVRVSARQSPLSDLARFLPTGDNRKVVDKTGVAGKYDFELEYSLEHSAAGGADPPDAPNVFNAVQQQLGLQLIDRKTPFDVLVIEAFERKPTEN